MLGAVWLGAACLARGEYLTLGWASNTETNVTGYRLYQGFGPRSYAITNTLSGRETESVSLELRIPDETHYFTLTALSGGSLESDYSNEVVFRTGRPGPGVGVQSTNVVAVTVEDRSVVVFAASSPEDPGFSWIEATPPVHGRLATAPEGIVYTPEPDFHGEDPFRLFVLFGATNVWKVSGTNHVASVQDRPVAYDTEYLVRAEEATEILLYASDPDGDALVFRTSSRPLHGQLSGTPPSVVYQPEPGFVGTDSFAFVVSDGHSESIPATALLRVESANRPPPAVTKSVSLTGGLPLEVGLTGTDPEGGPVTFTVIGPPEHGSLEGASPALIYRPDPGFQGEDRLQYLIYDLEGLAGPGVIVLNVRPSGDQEAQVGCALWSDGRLGMAWKTGPGGRYAVMARTTLDAGGWTPIGLVALAPEEAYVFWTVDLPAAAAGFYQLEQIAPR